MTMGNIFQCIKIPVMGRDLYTAFPTCRPKKVQCARVIEFPSIDIDIIVMKSFIQRAFCGTHPKTIGALREPGTAPATKAKAYLNTICRGCYYPESCITLGIDLGVLLPGLIESGWFKIFNDGRTGCLSRTNAAC